MKTWLQSSCTWCDRRLPQFILIGLALCKLRLHFPCGQLRILTWDAEIWNVWKPTVGAGSRNEWESKECHQSLHVYQASSSFVVSSWCHINRYYTGIAWSRGQVTHIHEGACCGARCHERSASATATANKKARPRASISASLKHLIEF